MLDRHDTSVNKKNNSIESLRNEANFPPVIMTYCLKKCFKHDLRAKLEVQFLR